MVSKSVADNALVSLSIKVVAALYRCWAERRARRMRRVESPADQHLLLLAMLQTIKLVVLSSWYCLQQH
jgi:hypothetical protein